MKFGEGSNDGESWKGYVAVNHSADIFEDENKKKFHKGNIDNGKTYGIKLYRPLYGSRDAPLRWFLTISQILRQGGFVQFKTDCCLFGRYELVSKDAAKSNPQWIVYERRNRLAGVVMLHADDMLFTGTAKT